MLQIDFTNLAIGLNWFLFIFFFLTMALSAILIPRFLVNLLNHWKISSSFLGAFLLSIITSLPEVFTLFSFTVFSEQGDGGIVKVFANIFGSNWITTIAFALLLLSNLFFPYRFYQKKAINSLSLLLLFLNFFLLLVFLLPNSFLAQGLADFNFLSFFFLIIYCLFLFGLLFHTFRTKDGDPNFTTGLFQYRYSPFLLFGFLLLLLFCLVTAFVFLVPLSAFFQTKYEISDQSIGGLFFASATSSTEIWTCLSLAFAGWGHLGLLVILESHLFNLILLVAFAFFTTKNVYQIVASNLSFWVPVTFFVCSFLIFWQTWTFFDLKKVVNCFLSLGLIAFSFFGLLKLL